MSQSESRPHKMLALAAFIVVVAGMKAASPILVPFLLSLFLAVIAAPPMFWLRDRGLPNWLALLAVVAVIVVVGIGLGAVVSAGPSVTFRVTCLCTRRGWRRFRQVSST